MYTSILKQAETRDASYCDVRIQDSMETSIKTRDEEVVKSVCGKEKGFGIRVLVDGAWGFHSSNQVTQSSLQQGLDQTLVMAASSATLKREDITLADVTPVQDKVMWDVKKPPSDFSLEEKRELSKRVTDALQRFSEVKNVRTSYVDSSISTHFLSSEGADVTTDVVRTFFQADIVVRGNDRITSVRTRVGGTQGLELFDRQDPVEKSVEDTKKAIQMLSARASPSGRMCVIADPELAGVFAHEVVGHACEADLVVSGESILQDRIGERIGSEQVSIIDDPTIRGAFGSFPYDDEGLRAQKKMLIEGGVLRNFIHTRHTAHKLGMPVNGGARAQSFAQRPLVRMSNTFIESGTYSFDELVEDVEYGVYAKGTRGGQVDVVKGNFQFSAQEAYLIENGRVTEPLRDFSLSGSTLRTMKNIDAVGEDSVVGDPGFCGKGQMVPVGDGGPHIRIQDVIVGGKT